VFHPRLAPKRPFGRKKIYAYKKMGRFDREETE
ncbi:unnamed protein product, partial [marine sediment metagenome]